MTILLDSASVDDALAAAELGFVGGVTTNPTLMARETAEPLTQIGRLPRSFLWGWSVISRSATPPRRSLKRREPRRHSRATG